MRKGLQTVGVCAAALLFAVSAQAATGVLVIFGSVPPLPTQAEAGSCEALFTAVPEFEARSTKDQTAALAAAQPYFSEKLSGGDLGRQALLPQQVAAQMAALDPAHSCLLRPGEHFHQQAKPALQALHLKMQAAGDAATAARKGCPKTISGEPEQGCADAAGLQYRKAALAAADAYLAGLRKAAAEVIDPSVTCAQHQRDAYADATTKARGSTRASYLPEAASSIDWRNASELAQAQAELCVIGVDAGNRAFNPFGDNDYGVIER